MKEGNQDGCRRVQARVLPWETKRFRFLYFNFFIFVFCSGFLRQMLCRVLAQSYIPMCIYICTCVHIPTLDHLQLQILAYSHIYIYVSVCTYVLLLCIQLPLFTFVLRQTFEIKYLQGGMAYEQRTKTTRKLCNRTFIHMYVHMYMYIPLTPSKLQMSQRCAWHVNDTFYKFSRSYFSTAIHRRLFWHAFISSVGGVLFCLYSASLFDAPVLSIVILQNKCTP